MGMSKKAWLTILIGISATPVLIACAFFTHLYFTQESIIFPAAILPPDHEFVFELPFEEVTIDVVGAELNGLHFRQAEPRGLVFFLHGNGGNLESWTTNIDFYRRVNYDLFIFDYRGYGKSTGHIQSEAQLHDDVQMAWQSAAPQYDAKPIVIYGRSLGAALAAKLAVDVDADLLILVSPFSSMVAMARRQYPLLPDWLVRYPLRTDHLIGDIQTTTLFVHGDKDEFIPLTHSRALRNMANMPRKLLVIEGAGHNDVHQFKSYIDGLTNELPD